jgi:hypothetical protein
VALVGGGQQAARKIKWAQILLAADVGISEGEIAASVAVGTPTVFRTRRRFVKGDLEAARKLSGTQEALLVEALTYAELTGNPHLPVNSVC